MIHYEEHKKIRQELSKLRLLYPRLIGVYEGARQRCNNSHAKAYKSYGRRGIQCFLSFAELVDIWNRDKAYLLIHPSLDRKNNDGNYSKDNCQFIEQSENVKKRKEDNQIAREKKNRTHLEKVMIQLKNLKQNRNLTQEALRILAEKVLKRKEKHDNTTKE
jgi:hypothetical protein